MKTKGLIKKYKRNYDLIISLYSLDMLDLTQRQLNRFIKKRGERKYPRYEIKKGRQVINYEC